mmetsp:Transcript_8490/g.34938  ORF Transcript_8490/g.34938 Transcript_8490/m.34938 type:complete len:128 (+) Transcript_8490:1047-1430(+)
MGTHHTLHLLQNTLSTLKMSIIRTLKCRKTTMPSTLMRTQSQMKNTPMMKMKWKIYTFPVIVAIREDQARDFQDMQAPIRALGVHHLVGHPLETTIMVQDISIRTTFLHLKPLVDNTRRAATLTESY